MFILRFFFNNLLAITSLVISIFALLVIYSMLNHTDTTIPTKNIENIEKIITVEMFTPVDGYNSKDILPSEKLDHDIGDNISDNIQSKPSDQTFYEQHHKTPQKLELQCNKLNKDQCVIPSHCVLRNGTDCVAGDKRGPTYHGTIDKPIHTEYYYSKNTCYNGSGSCPV